MSYDRKLTCGKCGVEVNGSHAIAVQNPDGPGACGLLIDLCGSCFASKDLQQVLQDRLYPKNTENEQAVIARNEDSERARKYEASRALWYENHPGEQPPEGHE